MYSVINTIDFMKRELQLWCSLIGFYKMTGHCKNPIITKSFFDTWVFQDPYCTIRIVVKL